MEQARQTAEEADRAAQTASAAAQSALAAADEARRSLRRDAEALLPERFAAPEGQPPVQLTFALMNTVLSEETAALQAARTDCTASLRQAGADCQRKAQLEADRQAHTRQRPALEQQVQEADRTAAAQSARVQALEQQVLAKQKALPYPSGRRRRPRWTCWKPTAPPCAPGWNRPKLPCARHSRTTQPPKPLWMPCAASRQRPRVPPRLSRWKPYGKRLLN